jgi:ABC-type uncharacterized transport system substrate-binding protein
MTPRRGFLIALALATLPIAGQAQARLARIGFLANSVPLRELIGRVRSIPAAGLFEDGLRERGWEDGRNVTLVWQSAEGRYDRLPALAAELVAMPVDVIVAFGAGVTAAGKATRTIPVVGVFGSLGEAWPSRIPPNITGVTLEVGSGFNAKRLSLLKELSPGVSRVAFVVTRASSLFDGETLQAARTLGVTVFEVEITDRPTPKLVGEAFDNAVRDGAGGLIVTDFPNAHWPDFQRAMHAAAARHRVPVIHTVLSAADSGGLAAYGSDILESYRRLPHFVDRILRGAKPADLPIEQQSRFPLVVNLKTAGDMGLAVPASILARAERVVR